MVITLFGKAAIFLPFTPVPIILQNSMAIFAGVALGGRRGLLTMLFFLLEGLVGLPVFSKNGGVASLLGPTGGYIWSYALSAYVAGVYFNRATSNLGRFLAVLAGHGIILLCGALWLRYIWNFSNVWMLGILPFIGGDLLKSLMIMFVAKKNP